LQGTEVVDEDMPDVNVEEDGASSSEPEPKKVKPKSLQEELADRGEDIELDAKRIIVVGASAGAHLALLTVCSLFTFSLPSV
jgi:dienelactone hydrolase